MAVISAVMSAPFAVHAQTWSTGSGGVLFPSPTATPVGIGNVGPTTQLDVAANTSGRVALRVNQQQAATIAQFRLNGTDKVVITSAGSLQANVGMTASTTTGNAIVGTASTSGTAFSGTSSSGNGVYATSSSGSGVVGVSTTGRGVIGTSSSSTGVFGQSSGAGNRAGVLGLATTLNGAHGVAGINTSADALTGVFGSRIASYDPITGAEGPELGNGNAVFGLGGQFAVEGSTTAGEAGVKGTGPTAGVEGVSNGGDGVQGTSTFSNGISGTSSFGDGVHATAVGGHGVVAFNQVTDLSNAAIASYPGSTSGLAFFGAGGIQLSGSFAEKIGGGPWTAPSDARIKKDVKDFSLGVEQLMRVRPVIYKYNGLAGTEDNGKEFVGVIAQELEAVVPQMVATRKAKLHNTDVDGIDLRVVDPNAFTYMLINAVKEQQLQIRDLEARLATVESSGRPLMSATFPSGSTGYLVAALVPVGLIIGRRRQKQKS